MIILNSQFSRVNLTSSLSRGFSEWRVLYKLWSQTHTYFQSSRWTLRFLNCSRTNPWKTEQIVALHRIFDSGGISLADLSKNFYFPIPVLTAYFVSFLVLIVASFLVTKFSFKIRFEANERKSAAEENPARTNRIPKRTWRRFLAHFLAKQERLTSIGVFVLFVQLFLWLSGLFLVNNIKTNQVVRRISRWDHLKIERKHSKTLSPTTLPHSSTRWWTRVWSSKMKTIFSALNW